MYRSERLFFVLKKNRETKTKHDFFTTPRAFKRNSSYVCVAVCVHSSLVTAVVAVVGFRWYGIEGDMHF